MSTSFERIYGEHFDFVWKSLRRLGVREADVADAAQEVFVVVYRKLGEFEGRSKVTTWLFGICLRVARDRQRLAHHRREVHDDDAVARQLGHHDVAAEAELREARRMLDDILDRLEVEQRAAFTLYELDGMSCDEIAELMGVPVGTVYSRLHVAREAFKKATERLSRREARAGVPQPAGGRP